jgi:DNA-binding response OmpR family regulator
VSLTETPHRFDLVVLDVMLPGKDGFAVVSELRHAGQFVPVLMLTARNRAEDVLNGFSAGADDYLPKPFELPILMARIRGLLRRTAWLRPPAERTRPGPGSLCVCRKDHRLRRSRIARGKQYAAATLMEANLLRYLIRHEGKAASRAKRMLEGFWGVREDTERALSTTSLCGYGDISRRSRPIRAIRLRCAACIDSGRAAGLTICHAWLRIR